MKNKNKLHNKFRKKLRNNVTFGADFDDAYPLSQYIKV